MNYSNFYVIIGCACSTSKEPMIHGFRGTNSIKSYYENDNSDGIKFYISRINEGYSTRLSINK